MFVFDFDGERCVCHAKRHHNDPQKTLTHCSDNRDVNSYTRGHILTRGDKNPPTLSNFDIKQ